MKQRNKRLIIVITFGLIGFGLLVQDYDRDYFIIGNEYTILRSFGLLITAFILGYWLFPNKKEAGK